MNLQARSLNRQGLTVQDAIETLQLKVDFPDLRYYINSKQLKLDQIIEIRMKAPEFRNWIQKEDRDFEEIVNIHNEASLKFDLERDIKKDTFDFFGIFRFHTALYPADKALPQNSDRFIESVGHQLLGEWKPLSIGTWLKEEIYSILNSNRKAAGKS